MTRVLSLCLLFLLVSCQNVQDVKVYDSSYVTEEEVVKVLEENHVVLKEAIISESKVFGTRLNNVKPGAYLLSDKEFYIYEFETETARDKGLKDFEEKTSNMNLVSFSKFIKNNVLIFYLHEQDLNVENIKFNKEIQEGLNSIIEG